jgi:hypothetical protein
LVIENGVVSKFDSQLNTDGSFTCSLTFVSLNATLLENDQNSDNPEATLSKSLKMGIDNAVMLTVADIMGYDDQAIDKIKDHAIFNKDPNDEFSMVMQRMMALSVSADSYVDMEDYFGKHEAIARTQKILPDQSIKEFCLDNNITIDQLIKWNDKTTTKVFDPMPCQSPVNSSVDFGCINLAFTPQEMYDMSNIHGGSHWKNRDGSSKPAKELNIVDPETEESDIIFKIPKINNKSYDFGVYWKVFDPILGAGNKSVEDISQEDIGVDDEYWASMKEQEILSAYIKSRVPSTSSNMYVSFKWLEDFLNQNLGIIGEGGKYLSSFDFSMYSQTAEGELENEKIAKTINYDESLFLHLSYISQHRETAFLYPTRDVYNRKFNGSVSLYDTFISVNLIRDAFETYSAIGEAMQYMLEKINEESLGIVRLVYSPGENINTISISDVNHDTQQKTFNSQPDPYMFSLNSPNTIVNTANLRSNLQNNDMKNLLAIQNATGENKFFPLTESDLMHAATKGINVTDKNHYYTWYPLKDTKKEEIKYKSQEDDNSTIKKYEYEDYQKRAIIKELAKAFSFKLSESEQREVFSLSAGSSIQKSVYQSTNLENVLQNTHTKAQESETINTDEVAKKHRENLFKKLLDPLKKEKNKDLWKNGTFVIDSVESYFIHMIKKKVRTSQRPMILLPYDLSFSLYGIRGLEPGHEIMVDFLPSLYIDRCKFLIKSVNHDISNSWKTTVNTMMVFKSDADMNVPLTDIKSLHLAPDTLFKLGYGTNQIERIYKGNVEWFRLKPTPWDNSLSKELIEDSFRKYTTEEPPKWIPDFNKYNQFEDYDASYDILYVDEQIWGHTNAYKIIGCLDPEAENYFCARRPVSQNMNNTAAGRYCSSAEYCPDYMGDEYCTDQVRDPYYWTCCCDTKSQGDCDSCGYCKDKSCKNKSDCEDSDECDSDWVCNTCSCSTAYVVEHIHDLCAGCNDPEAMKIAAAYEAGLTRPDLSIGGYNQYKHAGKFYIPQNICEGSNCMEPGSCPGMYPALFEDMPSGQCSDAWWKIVLSGPLGNIPEIAVAIEQGSNSSCDIYSYWDGECTYDEHWKLGPKWFGRGEGNECNAPTYCPYDEGGTGPCKARYKIEGEGEEAEIKHVEGDGEPWGVNHSGCYHWPWYIGDRPWTLTCGAYAAQTRDNPNTDKDEEGEVIKMDNSCCVYKSDEDCAIIKKIKVKLDGMNEEEHITDVTPYYCNRCYPECDGYDKWHTNCHVSECVNSVGYISSDYLSDGTKFKHFPYDQTPGAHLTGRKSGPKGKLCVAYNQTSLVSGVTCYGNPYCCNMYCDLPKPWWWDHWPTPAPASQPRAWPPEHLCGSSYKIEQNDYDDCEDP